MNLSLTFDIPAGAYVDLPLVYAVGDSPLTINWGDGSVNAIRSHTYAADGRYTVQVSPTVGLTGFGAQNWTGANYLISLNSWGTVSRTFTNLDYAFNGATNLISVPPTIPRGITSMNSMFYNASSFNGDISRWNTSKVQNMNSMFYGATIFNGYIGAWDTSNVQNMNSMFLNASIFNSDISRWNTSKVSDMYGIFAGARNFNQPIGAWNTSNVLSMSWMFNIATMFNQPIGAWDTSNVNYMSSMFNGATSFNQPIGAWNTSKVLSMSYMFYSATSFNQPIGAWDTSNVRDMRGMFSGMFSGDYQKFSSYNMKITINGWNKKVRLTTPSSAFEFPFPP